MAILNKLKDTMETAGITPEQLAVRAKISMATIMRARSCKPVSATTARLIAHSMKLKEKDLIKEEPTT